MCIKNSPIEKTCGGGYEQTVTSSTGETFTVKNSITENTGNVKICAVGLSFIRICFSAFLVFSRTDFRPEREFLSWRQNKSLFLTPI